MKIVNIIGGLGNQMFQYALAKSLETKFGDAVLVDTSLLIPIMFTMDWK